MLLYFILCKVTSFYAHFKINCARNTYRCYLSEILCGLVVFTGEVNVGGMYSKYINERKKADGDNSLSARYKKRITVI